MNFFLRFMTVDGIVADFRKAADRLVALACVREDQSRDAHQEALFLELQSKEHQREADRARIIAAKINQLLSVE